MYKDGPCDLSKQFAIRPSSPLERTKGFTWLPIKSTDLDIVQVMRISPCPGTKSLLKVIKTEPFYIKTLYSGPSVEDWVRTDMIQMSTSKVLLAHLGKVQTDCIVDERQSATAKKMKLTEEQWRVLITRRELLLHSYRDFFIISQQPSASEQTRKLATDHFLPMRIFRYGIVDFLEFLRHRLPDSFGHMANFVAHAYTTMMDLYRKVSTFQETWMLCLGKF